MSEDILAYAVESVANLDLHDAGRDVQAEKARICITLANYILNNPNSREEDVLRMYIQVLGVNPDKALWMVSVASLGENHGPPSSTLL